MRVGVSWEYIQLQLYILPRLSELPLLYTYLCKWWDSNPWPLNPLFLVLHHTDCNRSNMLCWISPPFILYRAKQLSYSPRTLYDLANFLLIRQAFQPCTYPFSTVSLVTPTPLTLKADLHFCPCHLKSVVTFVKLSSPSTITVAIL